MASGFAIAVFWLVQVSAVTVFFVPFEWSYAGLWAGSHFLRALGLTIIFHRYLAHRAFQLSRGARFFWALLGTAAMQKGPLWWAGNHIDHHKYADREGDPHSPALSGFYYAHIGWFLNDSKWNALPDTIVQADSVRHRRIVSLDRLAAGRGRTAEAGHRSNLPARRGGAGSRPDGSGRACRQDRAGRERLRRPRPLAGISPARRPIRKLDFPPRRIGGRRREGRARWNR